MKIQGEELGMATSEAANSKTGHKHPKGEGKELEGLGVSLTTRRRLGALIIFAIFPSFDKSLGK